MFSPQQPDPLEGTAYRTVRLLGSGGMGEVFLVQHGEIGKPFAAKLLHAHLAGDPRTVERMRIEAEATGQLEHPHIVSVAAVGRTLTGRPYLIMEFLHGRTLREELVARGGRLPVNEALTYACQALSALGAAHAIGVVHRDIKPDNLFVCDGARRVLKVLDFGVARVAPDSPSVRPLDESLRTETGVVIGSPRWQSPEGAMGRRVDARADVYAAALVLYVALAGRGPFDDFASDSMVMTAHAVEDAKPPSHYASDPLPPELDRAILKALSKIPEQRFQSADEFRRVLIDIAQGLRFPPGWLETSAFSLAADAPADAHGATPRPAAGVPASATAAAPAVDRAAAATVPTVRQPPWAIWLAVFFFAGLASAGLVALLHGGP